MIFIYLIGTILLIGSYIELTLAWEPNTIVVEEESAILVPNAYWIHEYEKSGNNSLILSLRSNATLKYYIVNEDGRNYLDNNNATYVGENDKIIEESNIEFNFEFTYQNEDEDSIWVVLKNENSNTTKFTITSFSKLFYKINRNWGLIGGGIGVVVGIALGILIKYKFL